VYYGFANDWSDPSKGAAVTDSFIARGVDVVVGSGDTQAIGAMKEAVSKGIYGIGYVSDFNNVSARWMLGSVYFNATGLMTYIIRDGLGNNLAGHFYELDLAHYGNEFILNPALVTAGIISQSELATINAAEEGVASYTISQCASGCPVVIGGPVANTFPPEPS
jgi:basic membrane lipoprotein Med (substrate-binding protein (PBP1-ABC) superfamily)